MADTDTKHLRPTKQTDVFWRGLYGASHAGSAYVVDVDYFDIRERVRLYRDGVLADERRSPATFDLGGGATIRASMALYGMKRAELTVDGAAPAKLVPLAGTAEAKRMAFDRERPALSTLIAALSWIVLAIAAITQVPNMLNGIGRVVGFSVPAFALPDWLNLVLGVLGIAAALDRALRMKHNPLLDD